MVAEQYAAGRSGLSVKAIFGIACFIARRGRLVLVAGLCLGIALPDLALAVKPWIGELIACMLFLAAFRVGPKQAFGALGDLRHSLGFTLLSQLILPVAAVLLFGLAGWQGAIATGLILMMSAPSVSGSPNLTILTGNDPAPALRQLVLGTALVPLTVIPVFWLAPSLGSAGDVLAAAARLLVIIGGAAGVAFLMRALLLKKPSGDVVTCIDGVSALVMSVVVIGLMSAVGPALTQRPQALLAAFAAAVTANFGLQLAASFLLKRVAPAHTVVPLSIVAGNRNIALFLIALPASVTDPLLLFIGCYQIPMYLTPIVLGRIYRRRAGANA